MEDLILFKTSNGILIIESVNSNTMDSSVNNITHIKFSLDYIKENFIMVSTLITFFIKKHNISICMINTNNVIDEVLDLLNEIPSIKSVIIKKDLVLTDQTLEKISQNKNIKYLDCYEVGKTRKKYDFSINKRKIIKTLKIIPIAMAILLTISLSIYGITSYIDIKDDKNIEENLSDINNIKEKYKDEIENNVVEENPITNNEEKKYTNNYANVIQESKKTNPDTIGWIKVNNTTIDYPVVQTTDNDYYLHNDFKKNKNYKGWIFMDFRNNPKDLNKNTIIYGHNIVSSGIMFNGVTKMFSNDYLKIDENNIITFNTEKADMKWKVFSMYIIDETSDYLRTTFTSDDDFNSFIKMIRDRSQYSFDTKVTSDDKIITLSTCHSDVTRYVVHAVLLK